MHHRILRTLVALASVGALAGGTAAYASAASHHQGQHHLRHYPLAPGATGMSGPTGSDHCPGM
jgi:hypothetical protein